MDPASLIELFHISSRGEKQSEDLQKKDVFVDKNLKIFFSLKNNPVFIETY